MAARTGTIFNLTINTPHPADAFLVAYQVLHLHPRSKTAQELAMNSCIERYLYVRRALHRKPGPVQYMGVNHLRQSVLLPFAIPHHDLTARKINIFHPQPDTLHESKAAAIQKSCHQGGDTVHFGEKRLHLVPSHHFRQVLRPLGPGIFLHFPDRFSQRLTIQKDKGVKGLILRACRDFPFHSKILKILSHCDSRIKVSRVGVFVKSDEPSHPIKVGCLGANGVMPGPDSSPDCLDHRRKTTFHLAGNNMVAKHRRPGFHPLSRMLVCRFSRSGLLRRTAGQKDLIENSQCMIGLTDLPLGNAYPFSQGGQERLNVLSRRGFEALLRDKFYEFLYPSKIELGTIRGDPGSLRAHPVSLPKRSLFSGILVFHGSHHKTALGSDSWMEKGNSC